MQQTAERAATSPASAPAADAARGPRVPLALQRVAGAALLVLALAPVYRLLEPARAGLPATATIGLSDVTASFLWTALPLLGAVALAGAWLLRWDQLRPWATRARAALLAPSTAAFAAGVGALAAGLTVLFNRVVFDGQPNLVDAVAQLIQARYFAAGHLAGPTGPLHPFVHVHNTVVTPAGWVSQYPPLHALLLAAGLRVGLPWLAPALLAGGTVALLVLAATRLFPGRPLVARLAGLLLAGSTFFLAQAGAYMNHVTAAFFAAFALWLALRALEGGAGWAIAAGAAVALVGATRPLAGLSVGTSAVVAAWCLTPGRAGPRPAPLARRLALATLGGLPVVAAVLAWNAHFFGSPLRFGYEAALGPHILPGFHRDPWGNLYGPREALAFTSSDLTALGLNLLEWPVSAVALVGLFLVLGRRLGRAGWVVLAWALAPVVANVFYWHHGLFMGPRMLAEATPAWALLLALALTGLVERAPAAVGVGPRSLSPRAGVALALVAAAAVGWGWLAPNRARLYATVFWPGTRIQPPRVDRAALVFIHDPWGGRITMRLAGQGMRVDSVEALMRNNSTCAVARLADDWRPGARLDGLTASWGDRPSLHVVPVGNGETVRARDGERYTPACMRDLRSDAHGALDLGPRLWRGDLPGLPGAGAMFVRDLGPAANNRLIASQPDRRPLFFGTTEPEGAPRLMPYAAAMRMLWRQPGSAGATARPASRNADAEPEAAP